MATERRQRCEAASLVLHEPWPRITQLPIDPTLVTRRSRMLVDIETSDGPAYGDTLSWPIGQGPNLGEREVEVVMDVDVPRFERLVVKLLSESRQ